MFPVSTGFEVLVHTAGHRLNYRSFAKKWRAKNRFNFIIAQ